MRCRFLLVIAVMGCNGTIDGGGGGGGGDDGTAGPDAAVFVDAQPANEPAGLVGTTAAHNQVRAAHGVAPLDWDPALAAIAQGWANQCIDTDGNGLIDHNANRSDTYPTYVGENVYGSSGGASGTDAVALWVSEEADYDYANNTCSGVCGHYTQVVWAATLHVGCGISSCPNLTYGSTIVCDYGPGGNDGGRPY
jgi:pathogenesis-related protein 1